MYTFQHIVLPVQKGHTSRKVNYLFLVSFFKIQYLIVVINLSSATYNYIKLYSKISCEFEDLLFEHILTALYCYQLPINLLQCNANKKDSYFFLFVVYKLQPRQHKRNLGGLRGTKHSQKL